MESLLHWVGHAAVQQTASNLFYLNYCVGCNNLHQSVLCCTEFCCLLELSLHIRKRNTPYMQSQELTVILTEVLIVEVLLFSRLQ